MTVRQTRRPITSFAKVQALVGRALRNRAFQLRRRRVRELRYLDMGCGRNCNAALINMDYLWHPEVDLCWDIARGLPFADGALRGIFSEHCLEHFPLGKAIGILRECRRVLAPEGVLRVVVPDAQLYLATYCRRMAGDRAARFPYQEQPGPEGLEAPLMYVNRVFYQDRDSPQGHCAMYDFDLLRQVLQRADFLTVERCSFRQGRDATLLVDTQSRVPESLYVEATA